MSSAAARLNGKSGIFGCGNLSRLSDAELIQQLADQAKELGIKIDLNYSFAQLPSATDRDGSE
jgi:hypothetical protein